MEKNIEIGTPCLGNHGSATDGHVKVDSNFYPNAEVVKFYSCERLLSGGPA